MLVEEGRREQGEEQLGVEDPDEEGLVDVLFLGTDHRPVSSSLVPQHFQTRPSPLDPPFLP